MGFFNNIFGGGNNNPAPRPAAPVRVNAGLSVPSPGGFGGPNGSMPGVAPTPAPVPVSTTTSLDLPQNLANIISGGAPVSINEQALQPIKTGTVASNPNFPALDFRMQPTYADGGMVGSDGMPDVMGQGAGLRQASATGKMTPQVLEMQVQDFLRKHPAEVAEFKRVVEQLIRTGQLTPQELNMAEQLATTALQNPDMYQYIRQFAIQQGLANEQDLSPQYDEGLIFVILLAVRAVQADTGTSGNALQSEAPAMSMADGGYVNAGEHAANGGPVAGAGTGRSDSIPIRVSNGEYVIPAHVVKMKGKEFFDTMLDKYKDHV